MPPKPRHIDLMPSAYGTVLHSEGIARDLSDQYFLACRRILEESLQGGAAFLTTDTSAFGRGIPFDWQQLSEAIRGHFTYFGELIKKYRSQIKGIKIPLSSWTNCYLPKISSDHLDPDSANNLVDYHLERFRLVDEWTSEYGRDFKNLPIEFLFETLSEAREAIAAKLAHKLLTDRTPSKEVPSLLMSFVLNPNGKLLDRDVAIPDGSDLGELIECLLRNSLMLGTNEGYGINCSGLAAMRVALESIEKNHPSIMHRLNTLYINASDHAPAELDDCAENGCLVGCDEGQRARDLVELTDQFPHIKTLGGCCGLSPSFVGTLKKTLDDAKLTHPSWWED